jgi:hypothetical protein
MTKVELIDTLDGMVARYGMLETKEAWQTLKSAVLAQQSNNSAMPKFPQGCCECGFAESIGQPCCVYSYGDSVCRKRAFTICAKTSA